MADASSVLTCAPTTDDACACLWFARAYWRQRSVGMLVVRPSSLLQLSTLDLFDIDETTCFCASKACFVSIFADRVKNLHESGEEKLGIMYTSVTRAPCGYPCFNMSNLPSTCVAYDVMYGRLYHL
eukprot:gene194-337_t